MDLVADTNVWYDIGAGRRDPDSLKRSGHRLLATPTSFLEITSLIDSRNIGVRARAAQAVVRHADCILPDCEFHLASIWALDPKGLDIDWREMFIAVSQAQTPDELCEGVRDYRARLVRRVNLPLVKSLHEYQWTDFHDKIVDVLDPEIPGYKAARDQGKCVHAGGAKARKIAAKIRSSEAQDAFLVASYCRALLKVGLPFSRPSSKQLEIGWQALQPYIHAYGEYLVGCATLFAPKPNGLGDSDAFIYLQANRALLTRDRRWATIARAVCPSRLVPWPERGRTSGCPVIRER